MKTDLIRFRIENGDLSVVRGHGRKVTSRIEKTRIIDRLKSGFVVMSVTNDVRDSALGDRVDFLELLTVQHRNANIVEFEDRKATV